jgi:hypothetical protein
MNTIRFLFLAVVALISLPFLPINWLHAVSMKIFRVGVYTPDDVGILMLLGLIGLMGVIVISAGVWVLFVKPFYLRFRKN